MHEMSLTMNLLDLAEEHCKVQDGQQPVRKITAIWLEIGALSCADPDTIHYCFEIASRKTLAEGAQLHIIRADGQAVCLNCERDIQLKQRGDSCPHCNGFNLKLTQGDELRIREIEVE